MDKKETSFMDLVGFECPLRGEKKLLLEKWKLYSVSKSISTWVPASVLDLKSENVNIINEGDAGKIFLNFLNLASQNEKMDGKSTGLPQQNITLPLIG